MIEDEVGLGTRVTAQAVLGFLAERVLGQRLSGEDVIVTHAASLTPGRIAGLSFAKGHSDERLAAVAQSQSSIILLEPQALQSLTKPAAASLIAVADPRREFARVANEFFSPMGPAGIAAGAVVAETAVVGRGTYIGPGAYVADGVVIGEHCVVGANAVVLQGTVIGESTSIGPNTTIGHVGFRYSREDDGSVVPVPHYGGVRIGSRVEIGANTCIDRGTLDDTVVEDEVKIDNLVHIAHNCRIRRGAFVIATAILCGGVEVGERAWVAPNASIREQLRIGADATVGLAATVTRDVADRAHSGGIACERGEPVTLALRNATILVLAPHTDDGELGAGASLLRWGQEGNSVHRRLFRLRDHPAARSRPGDPAARVRGSDRGVGDSAREPHDPRFRGPPIRPGPPARPR